MTAKLFGTWTVTLPDETYTFEPDDITVGESLMLEQELDGATFDDWLVAIDERRAVPCQVLIWFLRRKAGRQEDRMGVEFPIRRLSLTKVEDDPDPDPNVSADSESATSPSSPPSTESDPGSSTV